MIKDDLFKLCAGIAAGACDLKEMPRIAAPQQLLSVLGRLASITAGEFDDAFLENVASDIDAKRLGSSEEELYSFLDDLAVQFAREARGRRQ